MTGTESVTNIILNDTVNLFFKLNSRWPPVHNKFLMNCCTTCVCCLTALSCDVYYEGICRIDFFRLVELHHSRKFLACCQNGTIFHQIAGLVHIFQQDAGCSTHTYHSRRQKFRCRRTACVEQFTGCYKTDHQLPTV